MARATRYGARIESRLQQGTGAGAGGGAAGVRIAPLGDEGTYASAPAWRAPSFETWQLELHGHRVIYRTAGAPPSQGADAGAAATGTVVLIHGMVNSSRHWEQVALRLAPHHRVIAPDLIGHGDSATPRGDYSMGAHAAFIRDMLAVLGIERATIVGHSLGGGVAMQFFYQFPQYVERLVLVSSGGLGHDVSPLLRSAALPGVSGLLALGSHPRVSRTLWNVGQRLRDAGVAPGVHLQAIARALRPLERSGARGAFLQTLRSVIDARGQRVSASDRLYLLDGVPTLIVWGERDRTIPVEHGRATHAAVPHSHFATLERAAHFPHLEDPEGLARELHRFIASTDAGLTGERHWAGLMRPRARRTRLP